MASAQRATDIRIRTALALLTLTVPAFGQSTVPINTKVLPARATPTNDSTDGLIVRFRSDKGKDQRITPPDATRLSALGARAGRALQHYRTMSGEGHVLKLSSSTKIQDVEAIAARLREDPDVLSAEPNYRVYATATPNDTYYSSYQWHYREPASSQGGANLPLAWDITTGNAAIVVAVLDTGILSGHPDFSGRLVQGYDFIADIATANDGNGRDSDPSDPGDWVAANECGADSVADNSSWHGSHVAGTIGAASNNSAWGAGVNWNSKILPVRVLGKCGGYLSDIVDAMRWSAGIAVSGVTNNANPAKVINMSLGGQFPCTGSSYVSAITDVVNAGAAVVVSAGNSTLNVSGFSPAGCSGVITVAAVGNLGEKASYSNFGTGVTLAAPGGNGSVNPTGYVWSAWNGGSTSPGTNTLGGMQGTSQAAPHIAGIASLLLSMNSALTPAQIKSILTSTVRAFPTGTGADCTTSLCGAGIVDAAAALQSIAAPVITSALSATGQVGTAFSYTITASNSPTSFNATGLPAGLSVNTSNGVISGTPTAATTSNVAISATNANGTDSATLVLTVNSPPPAITSALSATGQVGSAFSYTITASNSPTSFNATGLPAGLSVNTSNGVISGTPTAAATSNVTISAANASGTGSATLVLTVSPPPPVITSALSATGQVGTAFSYTITASNSPTSFNAAGLPAGLSVNTSNGVISGTPTTAATSNVAISATNAYGTGSAALVLTVNPPPPVITSALSATGQVSVAFYYTITARNSPTSFSATGLPAGLSLNTSNGDITGTPTTAATSNVAISATNVSGTDSATLTLTVIALANPPVSASPSGVSTAAVTANWATGDGNLAGTEYYAERATDIGFTQGLGNSGWTTAHAFTFTGLAVGTRYYFRVKARNSLGTETSAVNLPTTATLAHTPIAAAISGVAESSLVANWASSDGNPIGTEYYAQRATDAGFTQGLGNSGWTTAHSATFGGLSANTRYYVKVKARNADSVETAAADMTATATLAGPPSQASVLSVTFSSITVKWTPPPSGTEGYRVEASQSAGFAAPLLANTAGQGASRLGIDNLDVNTTYYLRVGSLNIDGASNFVTAGSTPTLYASTASLTITNIGPMLISVFPDAAPQITAVSVQAPSGSFPNGTNLRVTTGVSFMLPPPWTNQARLRSLDSRLGVEITAGGYQPEIPLIITMTYDPAFMGSNDPRTIQMASYSADSDQWSLLATNVDTRNRTITAVTPHLSLFAPFFVTAAADLAAVQVFPQPWEIGDASSVYWAPKLFFSNLPAAANVRLYTLTGELLWKDQSSQGGVLSWDGNKPGGKAASGTYLAVIEAGGLKRVRRVVLIR